MPLRLPSKKAALPAPESVVAMPDSVRAKLDTLGIQDASLEVISDLDAAGRWGQRYLVATPDRLMVFAVDETAPDGTQPGNTTQLNGAPTKVLSTNGNTLNGHALNGSAGDVKVLSSNGHASDRSLNGTLASGVINGSAPDDSGQTVRLELDVPLEQVATAEAKSLVGAAALEVRLKKVSGDGPAEVQVLEILRSSNAHSKALTRAAKQLEELRDKGALEINAEEDEK